VVASYGPAAAALPPRARAMRRCLPGTFDEAVTRLPAPSPGARVTLCRPGSSPPSLSSPMTLTEAEGLRQGDRRGDPCAKLRAHSAVAPLALAPMIRSKPGPQLARMNLGHCATWGWHPRSGWLPQTPGRGRRRYHHGNLARHGARGGRGLCSERLSPRQAVAVGLARRRPCCWRRCSVPQGAARRCRATRWSPGRTARSGLHHAR
jgi:hypothetical protein